MVGDCIVQFITACCPARRSALRRTTFQFLDTTTSLPRSSRYDVSAAREPHAGWREC
jgi:hypothetical protein